MASGMTKTQLVRHLAEKLGSNNKTIIDTGPQGPGVVPYLPLNDFTPRPQQWPAGAPGASAGGSLCIF